jgi:hypothetical protein
MHALMVEKGFQLKAAEEVERIQRQHKEEQEVLLRKQQEELETRNNKRQEELEARKKKRQEELEARKEKAIEPRLEHGLKEDEAMTMDQARKAKEEYAKNAPLVPKSPPYQSMFLVYASFAAFGLLILGYGVRRKKKRRNRQRTPVPML